MNRLPALERTVFIALVIALAVGGCATSPGPVYYTLPVTGLEAADSVTDIAAEIGPFDLPEYLDRPQIVTAAPDATLRLDEFHRWLEPLDEIFVRTLATNVGRQLGSARIFARTTHTRFDAPARVRGSVLRFETDSDGRAVLDVQWAIVNRDGNITRPGARSSYAADIGDAANMTARVRALGVVLEKFSADIADELRARSRP